MGIVVRNLFIDEQSHSFRRTMVFVGIGQILLQSVSGTWVVQQVVECPNIHVVRTAECSSISSLGRGSIASHEGYVFLEREQE